jgi:hypothetical protein
VSKATRGGAFVPLVIEYEGKRIGFFVMESSDEIDRKSIASAESFLKSYDKARIVFAVKEGTQAEAISDRMAALPLSSLLF